MQNQNRATVVTAAVLFSLLAPAFPADATVVDTTLSGTISGAPASTMAQGDELSLKTQGPISHVGPATQTITNLWSPESLALQSTSDITYPEDWELEYTVDGETWSPTAPGDLGKVSGVRAVGQVDSIGSGEFEATAGAELPRSQAFTGAVGGDGYDLDFGQGLLFNQFHHGTSAVIDCHKQSDGSSCARYTDADYSTSQASRVYYNDENDHLYSFVGNDANGDTGVLCLDYSDVLNGNITPCGTEFTSLVSINPGETTFNARSSSSSRMGNKLYAIDSYAGKLICFDMDANAGEGGACDVGNGFTIGSSQSHIYNGLYNSRVTALEGRVFFTVNDTFGCFDPNINDYCGENLPVAITAVSNVFKTGGANAGAHRHAPVPVENTDGTFLGVCDVYSQTCLDTNGETVTIPSGLSTFWNTYPPNHYIAGVNAQQWGYSNHRLYYAGVRAPDLWSKSITCWDYQTDAACAGFDGTGRGITEFYSANIDPGNPSCVWINQNSGRIIPLDATTGQVGCAMPSDHVNLPITASVTRMACDPTTEVLNWEDLTINLPEGVDSADVSVDITNSSGTDLVGWTNLVIDQTGVIDISTLDTADSGLDPVVVLNGLNGVDSDELQNATAEVTFSAEEPEICINLTATTNCPDGVNDPLSTDVPDGLVWGKSSTIPEGGGAEVASEDEMTVTGTNTGNLCSARLPGAPPPNPLTVYFTSISPKLSTSTKSDIKEFVEAYDFKSMSCVGSTQGSKLITWLGKQRAAASCAYAKSLNKKLKTKASVVKTTNIQASFRSVVLTGG
jgi:hypothetical protein